MEGLLCSCPFVMQAKNEPICVFRNRTIRGQAIVQALLPEMFSREDANAHKQLLGFFRVHAFACVSDNASSSYVFPMIRDDLKAFEPKDPVVIWLDLAR